jgi:hypothetical protein
MEFSYNNRNGVRGEKHMTPENFCYWLKGFFEISGDKTRFTPAHLKVVKYRLDRILAAREKKLAFYGLTELHTEKEVYPEIMPGEDEDETTSSGIATSPIAEAPSEGGAETPPSPEEESPTVSGTVGLPEVGGFPPEVENPNGTTVSGVSSPGTGTEEPSGSTEGPGGLDTNQPEATDETNFRDIVTSADTDVTPGEPVEGEPSDNT